MIKQVWFCDYCHALGVAVYDGKGALGMGQCIRHQHAAASPACVHDVRVVNTPFINESTILLKGELPEEEHYADDRPTGG
jgi:hypothetical protein